MGCISPGYIETSGKDFQTDVVFQERVRLAFKGSHLAGFETANAWENSQDPEAQPLRTNGDEAELEIIAVFGLGARPKALFLT